MRVTLGSTKYLYCTFYKKIYVMLICFDMLKFIFMSDTFENLYIVKKTGLKENILIDI